MAVAVCMISISLSARRESLGTHSPEGRERGRLPRMASGFFGGAACGGTETGGVCQSEQQPIANEVFASLADEAETRQPLGAAPFSLAVTEREQRAARGSNGRNWSGQNPCCGHVPRRCETDNSPMFRA